MTKRVNVQSNAWDVCEDVGAQSKLHKQASLQSSQLSENSQQANIMDYENKDDTHEFEQLILLNLYSFYLLHFYLFYLINFLNCSKELL